MSNHYWNEYMNYYVDDYLLKDTLKYHQKTCKKIYNSEVSEDLLMELCKADKVKTSDVRISELHIDDEYINKIIFELKKIYKILKFKVSFPLFVFLSQKYIQYPGVYSYDFEENVFLKIGELKNSLYDMMSQNDVENHEVLIPFFLNIVQSLVLYQEKGYIRGIEEIGFLCETLKIHFKEIEKINLPEQQFTHEVGVNLRKSLLIDIIAI